MNRIYYNDIDKNNCAWLAELMRRDIIPAGDIDDRSIADVQPGDVAGYRTCHFFAGIGVWAYAGRLAGLPDDYPWWSGSCPCQPFSVSGKRRGTADSRHLWPHLFRLIRARRPACILGEQVAQALGWNWFNGVRSDLAGEAYQCRGIGLCSCAVDSPDERERIYWGAVADDHNGIIEPREPTRQRSARRIAAVGIADVSGPLVNGACFGRGEGRPKPILLGGWGTSAGADAPCALGHRDGAGLSLGQGIAGDTREERATFERTDDAAERYGTMADGPDERQRSGRGDTSSDVRPNERRGVEAGQPWRDVDDGDDRLRNGSWYAGAEWIACHDGKARRAKPGTSMLVAGSPGRIPLWRGLGGSINAQLAAEVIGAFMETIAP